MSDQEYRLLPVALAPHIRDALVETGKCFMPETLWAAIHAAQELVEPPAAQSQTREVASMMREACAPEDFGVPAQYAERALNYAKWYAAQSQASAAPVLTDADIADAAKGLLMDENGWWTTPTTREVRAFARNIARHLAATPAKMEVV